MNFLTRKHSNVNLKEHNFTGVSTRIAGYACKKQQEKGVNLQECGVVAITKINQKA